MKILTINCVYEVGSTGKIIKDISTILKSKNCEFIHCYEFGELVKKNNVYRLAGHYEFLFYYVWSRIIGLQYGTGYISTHRLIRILKKHNPDIVHIHCPNVHTVNLYKTLTYLKKNKISTVITNHAEYFYTGNCAHSYECKKFKSGCGHCPRVKDAARTYFFDRTAYAWKKMKDAFSGFEKVVMVSVSGWVDARLHQSPICAGLHSCVIGNGIDTVNVFRPVQSNELKIKLGISDEKILLHVTAGFSDGTDDLKGGRHIIALANLLINQNIKIIVVGFNDLDPNFILPSNVTVMGEITNQVELAKYYSLADLTVIASKRETFGMVCAESLCCGTPVVGFKSGGPETISLKKFSEFVDNGNVELLKSCVEKWITKKDTFEENIAEIAAEHYSKEKMAEEYYQLYEKFLNE